MVMVITQQNKDILIYHGCGLHLLKGKKSLVKIKIATITIEFTHLIAATAQSLFLSTLHVILVKGHAMVLEYGTRMRECPKRMML